MPKDCQTCNQDASVVLLGVVQQSYTLGERIKCSVCMLDAATRLTIRHSLFENSKSGPSGGVMVYP